MPEITISDSRLVLFELSNGDGHVFVNHHRKYYPELSDLLKAPLSSVLLYHGPMSGCTGNFFIYRMSSEKQVIACGNCKLRHVIPNDAMTVGDLMES